MTPAARSYRLWFWAVAVFALALDLGSKQAAFSLMQPGENGRIELIPRVFSLLRQPEMNRGALFGFGNTPETGRIANILFASLSGAAVLVMGWWSFRPSVSGDRLLCLALGLIEGGAAGNLFDRLTHHGVRDFLWVYYQKAETGELAFNWPVFNIADACLVVGAALVLLQACFTKPAKEKPATEPVAVSSPEGAAVNSQGRKPLEPGVDA
jgi:signal peptidase II